MKILHVIQGRPSPLRANGVENVVFYLSMEQARQGHDTCVVSITKKQEVLLIDGVRVFNVNPGLFFSMGLKRILAEDPDVIHFHSAYVIPFIPIAFGLWWHGKKYAITPHGNYVPLALMRHRIRKWMFKYGFEFWFGKKAAMIHTLGDEALIKGYGLKNAKFVFAPNAIPYEQYLLKPEKKGKERLFKVGFLGRLDARQKGLDILLETFSILSQKQVPVELQMVGSDFKGWSRFLKEEVDRLNIGHMVTIHGPRFGQEKINFFHQLDLFVHPSRYEGGSVTVVEAAAVGLPLLLSEGAWLTGMGVKRDLQLCELSPTVWADRIEKIMNMSADTLREVGLMNREFVIKNFNWQRTAHLLDDGYKKHIL